MATDKMGILAPSVVALLATCHLDEFLLRRNGVQNP